MPTITTPPRTRWMTHAMASCAGASAIVSGAMLGGCADEYLSAETNALLVVQPVVTFPMASEGSVFSEAVRIANDGNRTLVIASVEVRGPAGVFAQEGLDGLRLRPGDETIVTLTCAPRSSYAVRGSMLIDSNGSTTPGTDLTEVYLKTLEPWARVEVSPGPVEFGRVRVRTTSTETIDLLNVGNADVDITEIFPVDPSGAFVVSEEYLAELPRTLAPYEEWSVDIEYTPTSVVRNETPLQVEYRINVIGRGREELVTMIGNGSAPCISVTPEDGFSFGPSRLNERRQETFTITNCSSGANATPLDVAHAHLLNTEEQMSADSFELIADSPPPFTLAAGESSRLFVRYTPKTLGVLENAWLEILSSDEVNSPLVIELSGIGAQL